MKSLEIQTCWWKAQIRARAGFAGPQKNNMPNEDIKQSILEKIKKDEIKMTPKQFFVMKWFTLLITSIFFLILSIYILAYVIFLFADNGLIYIPLFTQSGLIDFIIEIPWTLVFLGLFSVFLFSITSKTFYKIYRKPFLTFFFSILIIIVLSHIILLETGGMQYLKEEAYREKIQLVPNKLLNFRDSQTGAIVVGYVVSTTSESLVVRDRKNNFVELFGFSPDQIKGFSVGQLINAYTERSNQLLYVKSIEIVR